jgi:hypothetical protein
MRKQQDQHYQATIKMDFQERQQIEDTEDWNEILQVLAEGEENRSIHMKKQKHQTRILDIQRIRIMENRSKRVLEDQKRALDTKSVLASNYVRDHQNAFSNQFGEIEMIEEMGEKLKEKDQVSEVDWEDFNPNDRDAFKDNSDIDSSDAQWKAWGEQLAANTSPGLQPLHVGYCTVTLLASMGERHARYGPEPWMVGRRLEHRRADATATTESTAA